MIKKNLLLFCMLPCLACCSLNKDASPEFVEAYIHAHEAYETGQYAKVLTLGEPFSTYIPCRVLCAKARFFLGDKKEAESEFTQILHKHPSSVEAALFLVHIYRTDNRNKDAQALLEKVLGDDPYNLRALRLASELAFDRAHDFGVSDEANGQLEKEKAAAAYADAAAYLDRAADASVEAGLVFISRARLRWIAADHTGALEDLQSAESLFASDSAACKAVQDLAEQIRESSL